MFEMACRKCAAADTARRGRRVCVSRRTGRGRRQPRRRWRICHPLQPGVPAHAIHPAAGTVFPGDTDSAVLLVEMTSGDECQLSLNFQMACDNGSSTCSQPSHVDSLVQLATPSSILPPHRRTAGQASSRPRHEFNAARHPAARRQDRCVNPIPGAPATP